MSLAMLKYSSLMGGGLMSRYERTLCALMWRARLVSDTDKRSYCVGPVCARTRNSPSLRPGGTSNFEATSERECQLEMIDSSSIRQKIK